MQGTEKIAETIDKYIKLYNTPPYGREIDGTVELLAKCKEIICSCVDAGWIPVEERLPEKGERVIICTEHGFRCEAIMTTRGKYFRYGVENAEIYGQKIIAWMPLPEPHRSERSE